MSFNPELCRNESEVESKLIVQYLLPQLGYTPDTWHQEITFGKIRLDFLAFAAQAIPFVLDANSPLSLVMEAKSPKQNLNNHVHRLKNYLISLNVEYGLLTNGKEIRIYQKSQDDIQLVFQCAGKELDHRIEEIKALIGRDSLKEKKSTDNSETQTTEKNKPNPQTISDPSSETKRQHSMKVIAVYHNKGGVGKTTTVVNLAAAIRKKGKKVLVVDLDSQANTTFATGLVKFDDEDLDDIKDSNILQILQSEEHFPILEVARKSNFSNPEIDVVPSHIDLMKNEQDLNRLDYSRLILIEKLEQVKDKYDVVLIDTPPSLNLYARIALIAADYLIIPSDLKPFANQGLINVKEFVKAVNGFRKQIKKPSIEIIGVLACKISTNNQFVKHTLPKRIEKIPQRYGLNIMDTVIYERDDLAKCSENFQILGNIEVADPISILDFKPSSTSAQEFELLAKEVLQKIGMTT
ncbi:AAA family ATPase [Chlorogloeopsis fritschii PCC 9212]|uniref:Spo0A activation inhibitor soj n=1 Tax=Chlorogloeopsis fritschii PCC 6912 TaxID=211165 RepID=A0A433NMN9_CHLFR|nr:AAA family ATPase [Chlorogloeopsis fritschii]RUR84477.1 Spo0A activation inhibitor soj [Chlorogloeopsis fritschii PCC 6912]